MLIIHGGALSTVLDMSHKKCRTYVQSPSYMKTAYWFAPTFFIVNNVESRRCTLQNKHLGENPLFVGLRRLLSELRTKLARFACSNSGSPF